MLRIALIRPGATDYDEQGRILGTLDIPLSEEGARQVERIIDELRPLEPAVIYCGPSQASRQSAVTISEALGVKLKEVDALANVDHGLWQGLLIDDVKRKHPKVYKQWQEQPETVCPPEGEMLSEARQRVQAVVTKILKKYKEGVVGIVAPEPLASVIHCCLSQCETGDFWKIGSSCASWEVISVEASSPLAS